MISFSKYQGLGNDFILFDLTEDVKNQSGLAEEIKNSIESLCHRKIGVGADGVIIILSDEKALCRLEIYNRDGSRASTCGNGIRCVASYLYDQKRVKREQSFELYVDAGLVTCIVHTSGIEVAMGFVESIEEVALPELGGCAVSAINFGNHHLVVDGDGKSFSEEDKSGMLTQLLPAYASYNIEFIQVLNNSEVIMSVYEAGVGWTNACASGACATIVALVDRGLFNVGDTIKVKMPGGNLDITIYKQDKMYGARQEGCAKEVFAGSLLLNNL